MNCFVQLKWISLTLPALAATLCSTQMMAAEAQGQAAVMTSGNGVAVSGTWDANGFHGVYSGPTGGGRVAQPKQRKSPFFPKPGLAAVTVIGQGAVAVIGDQDDDAGAVSVGAFAGVGTSGAVAISGPGGMAVGVPGLPPVVVGSGTYLWNDVPKPPRIRSNHNSVPQHQHQSGKPLPRFEKDLPQPNPVPPPPPPRFGSSQSDRQTD